MNSEHDRGGGVKKSENFADVIYGSPLTSQSHAPLVVPIFIVSPSPSFLLLLLPMGPPGPGKRFIAGD